MDEKIKSYLNMSKQIGFVMSHDYSDASELKLMKKFIQESYTTFGHIYPDKVFLNLGLWDKTTHKEYNELNFNFSKISEIQDIRSYALTTI